LSGEEDHMTNFDTTSHPAWQQELIGPSTARPATAALRRLVDRQAAVLVLRDVIDDHQLAASRQRIFAHYEKKTASRYHNGTLTTIGPYLVRHLNDLPYYFANAGLTDEVFAEAEVDLRKLVQAQLAKAFGWKSFQVEREPDGRRYADSIVRIHGDGVANPLHNDNIMRDAAGSPLRLAKLRHQLSCVVCVQECDRGGELVMYRKQWAPQDETFKVKDGLGYMDGVIGGVERNVFRPHQGDVYLINPTNYHEILRVGGQDRLTLSFFIGFYDDELRDAVLWS
jgi:hypothetical protein